MPWQLKDPRVKNPRGGWVWTEMGIELRESSPEKLAKRIEKMRWANGADLGDIPSEIAEKLAATDPWMVRFVPQEGKPIPKKDPFTKKLEDWTFGRMRVAPKFIHYIDAQARADICKACPKMRKAIPHATEEEQARYWKSLMVASKGQCASEESAGVGVCSHFNHDNRLAIWLEGDEKEPACCGKSPAPKGCWK